MIYYRTDFVGLDLYYTDPAQHLITAGYDLVDLDDLHDLYDLSVRRVELCTLYTVHWNLSLIHI